MIVALAIFISGFCFVFWLLSKRFRRALLIEQRVRIMKQSGTRGLQFENFKHLGSLLLQRVSERTMRMSPVSWVHRSEQQVRKMGERGSQALKRWLAIKLLWAFITVLVSLSLLLSLHSAFALMLALIVAVGSLLSFRWWMAGKIKKYQIAIRKQLPNLLDMLTISVEAGLGFDQALERNARSMDTELGRELRQILAEMSLGKSRRDALRDAGERVNVEEFQGFVSAIIQADRLGMGVAGVLRVQASEVRRKLGEKVKEQAMKAPIKILFPLVMFIFPALFIVILGPAVINIAAYFIK